MTWRQVDLPLFLYISEIRQTLFSAPVTKEGRILTKVFRLFCYCIAFPLAFAVQILLKSIWKWKEVNSPRIQEIGLPPAIPTSFPTWHILVRFEISSDGNWQFTLLRFSLYLRHLPHYQLFLILFLIMGKNNLSLPKFQ